MQINPGTRIQLNVQKWIFTLLLLCVLGMLAWLSQQQSWQADLTANKRNSLSRGSIELLHKLDNNVSIHVYARDDDPALLAAIQEIMERYMRIKPDFQYRIVNPDIDFELAENDGVKRYGEVIIRYGERSETISNLSEQAISSALLRMSRGSKKQVVFLSGHGERNPEKTDNRGYSKLDQQLSKIGFSITNINLLQGGIPDNTQVLVIAGTGRDIPAGEYEHIERFISAGGNLLWLVDPGELHGMQALATKLGIRFQDGMVVDNNIDLRRTLQIEHPAIIPVLEYYPHAVSKGINYNTLFPLARGIDIEAVGSDSEWQHQVLWRSFEQSWSETGSMTQDIVFNSADGDIAGPINLAVAIDKIITDSTTDKATQRIIVVGDSDFMANAYIGVGANTDLATNIFNWLAGDDDLIAVDVKNANDLQLQLSDFQVLILGAGFLLLLPAALLTAGGVIWYRRKRR